MAHDETASGVFAIGGDGHRLAIRCIGEGSPAVVLEPGTDSAGLEDFQRAFVSLFAAQHQTCVYDRAGTTTTSSCESKLCSDDPVAPARNLDDLVADLDALLTAAGVNGPYVLVGASGGGLIAVQYAKTHPDAVAALALLDVGVPNPNLAEEEPEGAGPNNIEHVDWFAAEEELSALAMPIGNFPVLVVVADEGETPDQSFWLALSPTSKQIILRGGHDIHEDDPEGVATAVLALLGG